MLFMFEIEKGKEEKKERKENDDIHEVTIPFKQLYIHFTKKLESLSFILSFNVNMILLYDLHYTII